MGVEQLTDDGAAIYWQLKRIADVLERLGHPLPPPRTEIPDAGALDGDVAVLPCPRCGAQLEIDVTALAGKEPHPP